MKLKKLLASVTAIALATSTMAFSAFAATVNPDDNNCGENSGTAHSWSAGTCSTCSDTCNHTGESITYTANNNGTHNGTYATCGATVTNESCDETGSYDKDSTQHWRKCSKCGVAKSDATKTNHTVTYDQTATQHTPKCVPCGWTGTAENHVYDNDADTSCNTCDYTRTVSGGDTPAASTVNIAFPTSVIQLTVGNNDGNAEEKKASTETSETALIGKTFSELKNTTLKVTGINLANCSIEGVAAADVNIAIYTMWGDGENWGAASWKGGGYNTLSNSETSFDLSSITGVDNSAKLMKYGIQISINNQTKLASVEKGDTVKINDDGSTERPVTGSASVEANNYWNQQNFTPAEFIGNLDRSTGVLKIAGSSEFKIAYTSEAAGDWADFGPADSFTVDISDITGDVFAIINTSANTPLNITWAASIGGTVAPATPADPNASSGGDSSGGDSSSGDSSSVGSSGSSDISATGLTGSYTGSVGEGDAQPKIPVTIVADNGKTLGDIRSVTVTVTFADGTWGGGCLGMNVGGNWTYSQWDNNDSPSATVQTPNGLDAGNGCEFQIWWLGGTGSISYVITYTYSDGTVGGGSNVSAPSNPSTPETPSLPASNGTLPSLTVPANDATGSVMVDSITAASADSVSFNLGSSAKLDKAVMEAIAAKGDITVRFNVAGGAYWEINGTNITNAKAVDLGVRMNSNLIPEGKVSEFAGDKTTIQLSLKHNGDLGFTGVLNVPINKSYNGKYANLYYYNGGKFDFVGSSAIAGGRAQFAFSHASNYLIVIDDYAYGEDVSSAAGMTETTTAETSTFPYVPALVVIAAFGTSAIVLKKRLSK